MTPEEFRALQRGKPRKGYDGQSIIRNRLQIAGLAFEEEFVFLPDRKFRADFFVPPATLIEFDGGIWIKGGAGHSRPESLTYDKTRDALAQMAGYRVFRFTKEMIQDGTLDKVIRHIKNN